MEATALSNHLPNYPEGAYEPDHLELCAQSSENTSVSSTLPNGFDRIPHAVSPISPSLTHVHKNPVNQEHILEKIKDLLHANTSFHEDTSCEFTDLSHENANFIKFF